MAWCLQAKLIQNWDAFSEVLVSTGDRPIVEYSTNDDTWGAILHGDYFIGKNALGRLLMQVRSDYIVGGRQHSKLLPPDIVGFMLFGYPIGPVYSQDYYNSED